MTEAELEKLLTEAIATQANFDAWWEADGTKLLRGKWDEFKGDLGLHELACKLFKLTPEGLVKMVAAVDGLLKQAADADAKGPGRIAAFKAVLARPHLLAVVAHFL